MNYSHFMEIIPQETKNFIENLLPYFSYYLHPKNNEFKLISKKT